MTAYPYSEERIRLPDPTESPAPQLTERMIHIIQRFGQTGNENGVSRDFHNLKSDIWGEHFGTAGDSNSVWGKQHRLVDGPAPDENDKEEVIDRLEAVGFILQDREPHADLEETTGLDVFVPNFERYLPINLPWDNVAEVNVRVLDYTSTRHSFYTYGIIASQDRLQKIQDDLTIEKSRTEYGSLYSNADRDEIHDVLQSHNLSYAVHNACISRYPEFEWFPKNQNKTCMIGRYSPASIVDNSKAHALTSGSLKAACGAITNNDENSCVVSRETALNAMKLRECRHPACQ